MIHLNCNFNEAGQYLRNNCSFSNTLAVICLVVGIKFYKTTRHYNPGDIIISYFEIFFTNSAKITVSPSPLNFTCTSFIRVYDMKMINFYLSLTCHISGYHTKGKKEDLTN